MQLGHIVASQTTDRHHVFALAVSAAGLQPFGLAVDRDSLIVADARDNRIFR
jgi:hypothetical protein